MRSCFFLVQNLSRSKKYDSLQQILPNTKMDDDVFGNLVPLKRLGGKYGLDQEKRQPTHIVEENVEVQASALAEEDENTRNLKKTNETAPTIMLHSTFQTEENIPVNLPKSQKRRKSHTESLKEYAKEKTFSSSKVRNNSFREKLLTGIKKLGSVQKEHGGEPNYLLIIKNNIQEASKQSTTAEKFIVQGEGPIMDGFLHSGIEYDSDNYVKLVNSWSLKTTPADEIEKEKQNQQMSRIQRQSKRNYVAMMEGEVRDEQREETAKKLAEREKRLRHERVESWLDS